MDDSFLHIIQNIILADALATPFEGMSKGHIISSFKNIDNFTDPIPALKNNIDRWKKPNLYSSISQLLIIITGSLKNRNIDISAFNNYFKDLPEITDGNYSIFRHPARLERKIITDSINQISDNQKIECSRLIPIITPFMRLKGSEEDISLLLIKTLNEYGAGIDTIVGSLIFISLLKKIKYDNLTDQTQLINLSIEVTQNITQILQKNTAKIFDLKINPDYLENSNQKYIDILNILSKHQNFKQAEIEIIDNANKYSKDNITRATINHPLLTLPLALFIAAFSSSDPSTTMFTAVKLGGSTVALATIASVFSAAISKEDAVPKRLFNTLINKKKIISLTENISTKGISSKLVNEFVKSEASLTSKEIDELKSKLKNNPKSIKNRSKTRSKYDLSAPTKESWNKKDKAKWKKEKQKSNLQIEDEEFDNFYGELDI